MKKNKDLTVEKTFKLAVENHKKNNLADAQDLYNQVLKIDPEHPHAHNNLGLLFQNTDDYQKAKTFFKKAIEIDPNYAHAYNNLGLIFQKSGDYQKAKSFFEKAIEIDPNYAQAHTNLGTIFKELGDYQKAKVCYEKTIKINSNHTMAHYKLGVLLFEIRQYKNAAEQFRLSDLKDSKSFLLNCLYKLGDKFYFLKELDNQIKHGEINALIGSLTSRSEIKYKIKRSNPFCGDPLKYVLKTDLTEQYNFQNTFIKPIKNFLKGDFFSTRYQSLLINGHQTPAILFNKKNDALDKIKNIIHLEVEKYLDHFKESKEGFIKFWPKSYKINAWLVSMKSGGKIRPHMHEHGWLSGSIYINVPPKLEINSGNLIVSIDDQEIEAENNINQKIIDVVIGSLCLFPASLHHYTIPFESNEERIVLAFDIIPT